jgi:copper(I)-binding protein
MKTKLALAATTIVLMSALTACAGVPGGATRNATVSTPAGASGASGITVRDAWARPTLSKSTGMPAETPQTNMTEGLTKTVGMGKDVEMDGPVSAAYMIVENSTDKAERLMSASSSVAAVTEIHETKEMDNGMMGMQPLTDGLEIPANGSVTLKPGGYHIMMMKLNQALAPGQTFTLTLKFQSGKEINLDVPVKEP